MIINALFAVDVVGLVPVAIVVDLVAVFSWLQNRWRRHGYVK